MKTDEILAQAGDTLGAKRVFGVPYEKNGVTIIPAARVMGGGGGADAGEHVASTDDVEGTSSGAGTGMGAGFGMAGSPAGAFVIKGDQVRWMPAIDVNRMMFGFQITLIVLLLVIRSIAKSRVTKA